MKMTKTWTWLCLGLALASAATAQDDEIEREPTKKPTTPRPTRQPSTAQPTDWPTPALDRSLVIAADESFLDFFVDPFDTDFADGIPPALIANNGDVSPEWKKASIVIPKHLDFFSFNLWHGAPDKVKPFFDLEIKLLAESENKGVLPSVKLSTTQSFTTKIEAEFNCISAGSTDITFTITRGHRLPTVRFHVTKECFVSNSHEFLISTRGGDVVFHDGKLSPAFNVHDLRGDSFIASKEDQSDAFYFHTIHREYYIVGRPSIEAYDAPPELLKVIAKRSPGLAEVVEEYAHLSKEEILDEVFYDEDSEGHIGITKGGATEEEDKEASKTGETTPNDNDDDDDDDDPAVDTEEGKKVKPATPTEIKDSKGGSPLTKRSYCQPTFTGDLWKKSRKGKVLVAHRKEYGEKKLLGFAQAGVLGLHGGQRLALNYNCVKDGLSIVVMKVLVAPKNGHFTPEEIRMSWLKVCNAGQISPDDIDLMGVNLRLGMYAEEEPSFFPILNGITTEPFTWDGISVTAQPDELATSFYLSMNRFVEDIRSKDKVTERIRLRNVALISKDRKKKVLDPRLSGHGAFGGIVTSDALPVLVHYNCKQTGTVRVGLDFFFDVVQGKENSDTFEETGSKVRRVSIYWFKVCSVTPISYLFVKTMNPEMFSLDSLNEVKAAKAKGVDMASKKFKSDEVVKKGNPTSLFSDLGSEDANLAKLYALGPEQNTIALELSKYHLRVKNENSRIHMGMRFSEPILTSSSSHVLVSLRDIGEMEEIFNIGKEDFMFEMSDEKIKAPVKKERTDVTNFITVGKDSPVFLVVDHTCTNTGDAVVTLQLPVLGNTEQAVSIRWVKRCHWSETKLSAKQTGGAVAFFVVLAVIGTSSIFCIFLSRQRNKIAFLQSRDKRGFDKMDVVSSI